MIGMFWYDDVVKGWFDFIESVIIVFGWVCIVVFCIYIVWLLYNIGVVVVCLFNLLI